MLSFKDFISERTVDPVELAQRTARIFGKKEKYGKWLVAQRGQHVPLKDYSAREANSVENKYFKVCEKICGKDAHSPDREKSRAAHQKVSDCFKDCEMKIHELKPTQPFVRTDNENILRQKISDKNPDHIRVVTHKGNHYVMDGHHAIMAAHLRGQKTINCKHLNMDDY